MNFTHAPKVAMLRSCINVLGTSAVMNDSELTLGIVFSKCFDSPMSQTDNFGFNLSQFNRNLQLEKAREDDLQ